MPDVVEAAHDADVLIFVIPHQFIRRICQPLIGKLKPTTVGISLIKASLIVIVLILFTEVALDSQTLFIVRAHVIWLWVTSLYYAGKMF